MAERQKVLIVTYYWPPAGGAGVQRWVKFAGYLPEFGIEPVILTVSNPTYADVDDSLCDDIPDSLVVYKEPSREPFGIYAKLTGKDPRKAAHPTTSLKRHTGWVPGIASWFRANVFVPDARVGWYIRARARAVELIRRLGIETVITTGPPHSTHLTGRHAKQKTDVRWIADFRDPWSLVFYNTEMPRLRAVQKLDQNIERSVLKTADEVLVVSPGMAEVQKRVHDRPYRILTNGFDHKDFAGVIASSGSSEVPVIRHIGTLPEASVSEGFFRALASPDNSSRLKVEFIGNVHESVPVLIEQYGLKDSVTIKPYMSHREAVASMISADLLVLFLPNTENNKLILTGKIFEYIGSGTPVMGIGPPDGDAARILEETGAGIFFEHEDVTGMREYLNKIMTGSVPPRSTPADVELKEHRFSRYQITRKLAGVIKS